jgi:alpha-galactosidase
MTIVHDSASRSFHLRGPGSSYVLQIHASGHLLHRHWGAAIDDADLAAWDLLEPRVHGTVVTGHPRLGLDQARQEIPTGRGDFRLPALQVRRADGVHHLDLRYVSHEVVRGKPALPGLPSTYVEADDESDTLIVTLADLSARIRVRRSYTQFREHDALARSLVVCNDAQDPIEITACASMACDLPGARRLDLITLDGAWAREAQQHRAPLRPGLQAVASRRGISGFDHHPGIVLAERNADERQGLVRGVSLVYSGSHRLAVEVDAYDQARLVAGIQPEEFTWRLEPGTTFQTPEAILVASVAGLGGMSRTYHRLYRTRLVPPAWRDRPRPMLINNWEGTYFAFSTNSLLEIARSARDLGCDLFVLDDGWFGCRDDDRRGLGDWVVNERKLPGGLLSLADGLAGLGMGFGLWFEPEMVNPDSDLARAHPDWCLHLPGHERWTWRNQLVLDLTRDEVREHIVQAVTAVLRSAPIVFMKWDMNRSLDARWSITLPADRQGEFAHRYALAVHDLHARIRAGFPELLIEGCASGGARLDPGMLAHVPQIWTSDDTDAIERLAIQRGISLFHPPSSISSHITAVPNHQVHRTTPLATRAVVAATAACGLELDPRTLSPAERSELTALLAEHRRREPLLRTGDLFRLDDDAMLCAWMQVASDRGHALVTAVCRQARANPAPRSIVLDGLDPTQCYHVVGPTAAGRWSGRTLMTLGLPMLPDRDAGSWQWELTAECQRHAL